jgi:FkbM family methyltransferase
MKAAAARARVHAWRFRTLEVADRAFAGSPQPLVSRGFAGALLTVDTRRSNVQRLLALEGERFVAERHLVRSVVGAGMHAIDVGANIGYYMLLLRQAVGASGAVTCFEPEPDNLVELVRNVERNAFTNVRVFPCALGSRNDEITIARGINASVLGRDTAGTPVSMRRLDDLVAGRVDFIKIDVEGYEGQVLRGAENLIREQRPRLFVEVHPWLLASGDDTRSLLSRIEELGGKLRYFTLRSQTSLREKVRSRYLGQAVVAISDPAVLVDERHGPRQEPFWVLTGGA